MQNPTLEALNALDHAKLDVGRLFADAQAALATCGEDEDRKNQIRTQLTQFIDQRIRSRKDRASVLAWKNILIDQARQKGLIHNPDVNVKILKDNCDKQVELLRVKDPKRGNWITGYRMK